MFFIDELKAIFLKKSNKVTSKSLNPIHNVISIPSRKDYKNNTKALEIINEYKKVYYRILSTNKTLVSKDLNFKDNLSKLELSANLLYRACINDEEDIKLLTIESINEKEKYLNIEIEIVKLELYRKTIFDLYEETKFRLIALKEIYKEHIFKFRKNKNAINSEIENLEYLLYVFLTQESTIMIKSNAYITELKTKNVTEKISEIEKSNLISFKLENLFNLANNLISQRVHEIKKLNVSNLTKIALIERELEIFVYTHPYIIEDIEKKLDDLQCKLTNKNLDYLLNEMNKLESILYIYDTYGRNILSDKFLYDFFDFKFGILIYNINNKVVFISPFKKENTKEFQYYKRIVMNIITGLSNHFAFELLFGDDKDKAITYVKKALSNYYGIDVAFGRFNFNPEKILLNILQLKLLCVFSKYGDPMEFDFDDFFKYAYVNKNESKFPFNFKCLEWEDSLPLKTIFDVTDEYYYKDEYVNNLSYFRKLYELRKLKKEHYDKYKLPDGLISIYDVGTPDINNPFFQKFVGVINNEWHKNYRNVSSIGKEEYKLVDVPQRPSTLYLPNEMQRFDKPIDSDINFTNLVLNLGILHITTKSIPRSVKTLNIPSSLETIEFKDYNLEYLYFDDFTNSNILRDKHKLLNFIELVFDLGYGYALNENKLVYSTNLKTIYFRDKDLNICFRIYGKELYEEFNSCSLMRDRDHYTTIELKVLYKIKSIIEHQIHETFDIKGLEHYSLKSSKQNISHIK